MSTTMALVEKRCAFCRLDASPDVVGETFSNKKWTAHQNCLYFSSGLAQSEDESDEETALCGFKAADIVKELRRGLVIKCCGCHKPGGYVGCAVGRCRKAGHFPCVQKIGFCFKYGENFEAYCCEHRPTQPELCQQQQASRSCCICLDPLSHFHTPEQIYCPSCLTLFHRTCLQKQALSAGLHHLCCALCKNKDHYCKEMMRMGIAIPNRDAAWEVDTNYSMEESKCCHANYCLCPHGRSHSTQIGKYRMRKCHTCGQWRGHVECLRGDDRPECGDCRTGVSNRTATPQCPPPQQTQARQTLARLGTKIPVLSIQRLTAHQSQS